MPSDISEEAVFTAIRRVADPCSIATGMPIDIVDMGLVKSVSIQESSVQITLRLTSPTCWQVHNITQALRHQVGRVAAVRGVDIEIDPFDQWLPSMMAAHAQAGLRRLRPLPPAMEGNEASALPHARRGSTFRAIRLLLSNICSWSRTSPRIAHAKRCQDWSNWSTKERVALDIGL